MRALKRLRPFAAGLAVLAAVAVAGFAPAAQAQRSSHPTGTQGIEGNSNCPPPVVNGITPRNWSCPTSSRTPPLQGGISNDDDDNDGTDDGGPGPLCRRVDPGDSRDRAPNPLRTMHDQAVLVFSNYGSAPIFIARIRAIRGGPGFAQSAWLLALSGLKLVPFTTGMGADQLDELLRALFRITRTKGMSNPQRAAALVDAAIRGYGRQVIRALAEVGVSGEARLVMIGHSLGGIVAQDLAGTDDLAFFRRWPHLRIITMGSPIAHVLALSAVRPVPVLRFGIRGDPVIVALPTAGTRISQLRFLAERFIVPPIAGGAAMEWVDNGYRRPFDTHNTYPDSEGLARFDALGGLQGMQIDLDPDAQYRCGFAAPPPPGGARDTCVPAFFPADWLRQQEDAGGHTLERHVGRTDQQLVQRLIDQPGIAAASTYPDEATAMAAIREALARHANELNGWAPGAAAGATRAVEHPDGPGPGIGRIALRPPSLANVTDGRRLRVVIRKMPDDRCLLLTSFPIP